MGHDHRFAGLASRTGAPKLSGRWNECRHRTGPRNFGEFAKALADRIHAGRPMPLADTAWCLEGGNLDDEARAWCAGNQVDVAQLVTRRPLSGYRVLAMDMDSTLIAIECIDELAALAGVGPKVAAITAAAMQGGLDFPSALKARVALLAGLDAGALARVYSERLELSPGAGALLDAVRPAGLKTLLVSGGFTYFTRRLASDLSLDHTLANELEIVGAASPGGSMDPSWMLTPRRSAWLRYAATWGARPGTPS